MPAVIQTGLRRAGLAGVGLWVGVWVGLTALMQPPGQAAETQPVTIRFAAKVGEQRFSCGSSYELGSSKVKMTPTDFRFYVSNLSLVNAAGKTVPLSLTQDGKWQFQDVALLDFEDKTAACANGTVETRDQIVGTVPVGEYRGLRFNLGVPFELNHADSTLAASPLNLTSLWWNWRAGYKFLRIDLSNPVASLPSGIPSGIQQINSIDQVEVGQIVHKRDVIVHGEAHGEGHGEAHEAQQSGFSIHIGSTGCTAAAMTQTPTQCSNPNLAAIDLTGFDPTRSTVIADLATLVATSDLMANQPDTPAGCMASPEDGDCAGIMGSLGLSFRGQPAVRQTFFRLE